jgi:hypothetical protein
MLSLAGLVALSIVLSGCRFKGWEGFKSATTPVKFKSEYYGDKGADGGLADPTGGTKVVSNADKGAKTGSDATPNYQFDTPQVGSGMQAGEYPGGNSDRGPISQGQPGSYSAVTGNVRG